MNVELSKTDIMLIKCSLMSEIEYLQKTTTRLTGKELSSEELQTYMQAQELLNRYNGILVKLS